MSILVESLRGAARRFGDRAALVAEDGTEVTYAELDRRSDEASVVLGRDHGIEPGAVVGLVLPSDPSYVVAYLALAKLGALTAGVSPRLAGPERARVLDRLGADLVLDDPALLHGKPGQPPPDPHNDPGRAVCIVFTSGSTGVPKGALFRDRQLRAIVAMDTGSLDSWGGGGPMIATTQFPHIGFMTKLPWYLRQGVTLLLQERWRAERTLQLVAEHRVQALGGVAAQIGLMLGVADFDRYDTSCVKTIVVGAGPSPAALVREARDRFGAGYSIRYSSTESGGVGTGTSFEPDEDEIHTVGLPRSGVELRLDPSSGEVLLRSPAVMDGYWGEPDLTTRTLDSDGWLHTGDLGQIDASTGRLRLIGRTTDMYIRGGYNVHPQEVEAVLLEHPAILGAAVAAKPDAVMSEVGVAFVVLAPGAAAPTLAEVRSFASGRLAGYKLPEDLVILDALPLTPMDKVDRRALSDRLR